MQKTREIQYIYEIMCQGCDVPLSLRTSDIPEYVYGNIVCDPLKEGETFISSNPDLNKEWFHKVGQMTYAHLDGYQDIINQKETGPVDFEPFDEKNL